MIVINGTKALLIQYFGEEPKETLRSFIVLNEDKPIGLVWIKIIDAKLTVGTSISDELRSHPLFKRIIVKAYRKWLKALPKLPVYAIADPEIEGSQNLLKHAGFEHFKGDTWLKLASH